MKKEVNFLESKTIQNLAKAYAVECMEGAKYQFLAKECEGKEYAFLKSTLKQLAKHEMAHAKLFWDFIVDSQNDIITNINIDFGVPFKHSEFVENFSLYSEDEEELAKHIYISFAKTAKDEGFSDIAKKFELVATVENCHSSLLNQIYTKLKTKKAYKSTTAIKWKCSQCGFEHTSKQVWNTCPLCGLPFGYAEIPFEMGE